MIEVGNNPSSSFGRHKCPLPQLTTASMKNSDQSIQNSSYLTSITNANELRHMVYQMAEPNGQQSIKRRRLNTSMRSYKIHYLKLKQIRKYFDENSQNQFLCRMFFCFTILFIDKQCDQSSCNVVTLWCNKNSSQLTYASIQTSLLVIQLIL